MQKKISDNNWFKKCKAQFEDDAKLCDNIISEISEVHSIPKKQFAIFGGYFFKYIDNNQYTSILPEFFQFFEKNHDINLFCEPKNTTETNQLRNFIGMEMYTLMYRVVTTSTISRQSSSTSRFTRQSTVEFREIFNFFD